MALYKMLDWGNPFSGRTTPREVVKTKKAWKRFLKNARRTGFMLCQIVLPSFGATNCN